MKRILYWLCCAIFLGFCSSLLLFAYFFLLWQIILTGSFVLQVIAVVLTLGFVIGCIAGAVFVGLAFCRGNTKSFLASGRCSKTVLRKDK